MSYLTFRAKRTSPVLIAALILGVAFMAGDFYATNRADVNSLFASKDPFVRANIIEAFFWMAIGVGFGCCGVYLKMRKHDGRQILALSAAITLVVFGFTDLVEAHTGAWWRPWPLLLWKGLCIISLLILFILYRRDKRRTSQTDGHK